MHKVSIINFSINGKAIGRIGGDFLRINHNHLKANKGHIDNRDIRKEPAEWMDESIFENEVGDIGMSIEAAKLKMKKINRS